MTGSSGQQQQQLRPSTRLVPNHNLGRNLSLYDLPELTSTSRPNSSHRSTSRPSRSNSPRPMSPARISTPRITPPASPEPAESKLLLPPETSLETPPTPLISFFHGSGDSCRNTWKPLAKLLLQKGFRILMFERSPHGDCDSETSELSAYLAQHHLPGPYILVAHSHGGAFARCFLHHSHQGDVAGMVLVETGQEATWDAKLQEKQEERHVLGHRPVVVIKGRSLLRKWKQIEKERAEIGERKASGEIVPEAEIARLMILETEVKRWEREDEKLKRRQLKLSKKHRFVELNDVGHHVVRDKPEAVVEGVEWVMENLRGDGASGSGLATPESRRSSGEQQRRGSDGGRSGGSWLKKVSLALKGGGKDKDKDGSRSPSR